MSENQKGGRGEEKRGCGRIRSPWHIITLIPTSRPHRPPGPHARIRARLRFDHLSHVETRALPQAPKPVQSPLTRAFLSGEGDVQPQVPEGEGGGGLCIDEDKAGSTCGGGRKGVKTPPPLSEGVLETLPPPTHCFALELYVSYSECTPSPVLALYTAWG